MIDILIIEDDLDKLAAIKNVIGQISSTGLEYVFHAENIIDARLLLERYQYDILIMDLVIPLRKDDNADAQNSCDLIEELESSPFLKEPLFIIGLTKFGDLTSQYSDFFEKRLYYLLQYEISNMGWQNKLRRIIFHLVKLKKEFLNPDEVKFKYDAAFISALYEPEFKAVMDLSSDWKKFTHTDDPTLYHETTITHNGKTKRILAAFADQMGMVACSTLATKIMMKFRPEYLFLTGITAAVRKKDVNYGDILVADLCWDYNSGRLSEFKVDDTNGEQEFSNINFEADPRSIPIRGKVKNKLLESINNSDLLYQIKKGWKGVGIKNDLQAHMGPLGTGSQVVASSKRMAEIKMQHRKLIGIEMEAYGLYYACTQLFESKITPIVIKSVCDFGDEHKNDDYHSYAAFTSAQFAKNFLFEYL